MATIEEATPDDVQTAQRVALWQPNLIVFVSNVCIMTVELVAGRIVAPFVGVSLYTWTSVIGVILAGISVGNYLGGSLADRYASRRTLGLAFIFAGLASLSVLLTAALVADRALPFLPLAGRIVVTVAAIFFIPSMALGLISPLVVKLTLQDLDQTGSIVGKIYATSAFGSIVGTFATGFVLISLFGTRAILLGVGAVLIAMGVLLGDWWGNRQRIATATTIVVLALLSSLLPPVQAAMQGPCQRESDYFCIRIINSTINDSPARTMALDQMIHSINVLDKPLVMTYEYERVYAEVGEYLTARVARPSVMVIGGGGYTFPRYLEARYPQVSTEVVEIDPAVTEAAYDYMGLSRSTKVQTINEDARQFLLYLEAGKKYDLIAGDAFNSYSVPYHLTTKEFNDLVAQHMNEAGIYMVNMIDGRQQLFLSPYLRTLQQTFPYVYVVPGGGAGWESKSRTTFVVLASRQPLDIASLRQLDGGDGQRDTAAWLLPDARVNQLIAAAPFILTDDYVPVDNLLAPVFEDAQK